MTGAARRRTSPEDYELIDAETVTSLLRDAGIAATQVFPVRPGTVRVQVRALTPRGRRRRQAAVLAALDERAGRGCWDMIAHHVRPQGQVAHRQPGRSRLFLAGRSPALPGSAWITVSDVGRAWHDDQGRDWYEHIAGPEHPDRCPPGHIDPGDLGA